jgi:hypothetical protein
LDDDDPFFLVKRLVLFFHMIAALVSLIWFRVSTGNKALQELFGVWASSGLRVWIVCAKLTWEGWLSLRCFWTENFKHTNREREELLACRRRAPGDAICRGGRPAWTDRPGWLRASPWLGFL